MQALAEPSTKAEPCAWVRDLDDVLSPRGQQAVAYIRETCQCEECKELRRDKE